ncbi:MAG: hypothetical protein Q8Q47_00100 [Ignavibacteriaceae bacterium]|nr:hypothetical protein [Ignavibacteriaceae bacterium]
MTGYTDYFSKMVINLMTLVITMLTPSLVFSQSEGGISNRAN